jgi:hypothetical protein
VVGFGFAPSPLLSIRNTSFLLSDFEFVVPFHQLLALCFHSFLKYQFEFVRQAIQNTLVFFY